MPQRTDIEWTSYSSNPLKLRLRQTGTLVNACVLCSKGCTNCYSLSITRRFWPAAAGPFPGYSPKLVGMGEMVLNEAELRAMLTFRPRPPYNGGQDRPRCFPFDMTDLFGPWVPFDLIDRVFAVFALRPDVDWQILTKRPERAAEYLARGYEPIIQAMQRHVPDDIRLRMVERGAGGVWPLPSVWLGTSVEDQQRADDRIPQLLRCPAAVRFLSAEPLLGPIQLRTGVYNMPITGETRTYEARGTTLDGIHWVIVGGESGPGARPMDLAWARSIVGQCRAAGVAAFCKQLGARPVAVPETDRPCPPGLLVPQSVGLLRDPKGGNMDEWPWEWRDLKVREFPAAPAGAATSRSGD